MALRLFVSIDPPPECVAALLSAADEIEGLPERRPTPPEHVHLTLQFIGDRAERELDETVESIRRSAGGIGPFALRTERLITLPRRGPARLIAAETDSPAPLLELQRRLAHRLARRTRQDAGDRFTPHMTLARFRGEARGVRIDAPLAAPIEFDVREIVLKRSVLHPNGAEHRVVERARLGGA
ncbi:MAG: RNA 2',3'-cyclic phosphodiesterase [Phycisphaerales bacterium]|nr:RNA 2',3'-cyclic phosphodiesterase [Phycisphaerales bacterium]MCB9840848.1 RNA 2',3'-cyclic phosphodiesterase [Phycisphaeraceae bacterium]